MDERRRSSAIPVVINEAYLDDSGAGIGPDQDFPSPSSGGRRTSLMPTIEANVAGGRSRSASIAIPADSSGGGKSYSQILLDSAMDVHPPISPTGATNFGYQTDIPTGGTNFSEQHDAGRSSRPMSLAIPMSGVGAASAAGNGARVRSRKPSEARAVPPSSMLNSTINSRDATTSIESKYILILPSDIAARQLGSEFLENGGDDSIANSRSVGDTYAVLADERQLQSLKRNPTMKVLKNSSKKSSKNLLEERNAQTIQKIRANNEKKVKGRLAMFISDARKSYLRTKVLQKDPVWFLRSSIRKIEGHLGTAIASFFVFTRWVFLLNIALSIIWLSLVIIPQATSKTDVDHGEFSAVTVFSGEGYLATTQLFYAGYESQVGDYKMDLAYVIAIGLTFFVSFMSILTSIGSRFSGERDPTTLVARDQTYPFAVAVLSSWDFSIDKEEGAKLMQLGIAHTLKEILTRKQLDETVLSKADKLKIYVLRVAVNAIVVILLALSAFAIYRLILYQIDAVPNSVQSLLAPACISLINLFVPWVFGKLVRFESCKSLDTEAKLSTIRSFLVRTSTIVALLVSTWLTKPAENEEQCFQNRIGQQFYSLLIADTIISSFATFFIGFGWRFFKANVIKRGNKVDFDMARNVLDITYRQSLIWLGTAFCPLMPIIGAFSLVITFYIRKFVYLRISSQPRRFFSSSRSNVFFLITLMASLILIFIPLGFIIVNQEATCGPHVGLQSIYGVVPKWIDSGPDWLVVISNYLFTVAFLIPVIIMLNSIIYYQCISRRKYKIKIRDLQRQLDLERVDKKMLLKHYHLNDQN